MYCAYITTIKNLREVADSDNLLMGTCFENNIIVNKNSGYDEVTLGVYFPTDGRLGVEYATKNNLLRLKDDQGNKIGGYLDAEKRNIRALKLRGQQSDGLFMPLTSLKDFCDISKLAQGDTIDVLDGVVICEKYIPLRNNKERTAGAQGVSKKAKSKFPLFKEHIDTKQLNYNLEMFNVGDEIILTEKVHGTSSRIGYTIKEEEKQNFFQKLLKLKGKKVSFWDYVSGTRRVVLSDFNKDGFYENNFREKWHNFFKGKLYQGEIIYGEIVGATAPNALIMGSCDNKKTKDKAFIRQYGEVTKFSYGCDTSLGENDFYIYRITKTAEDGSIVEYPFDLIKMRAEQMGAKVVPEFERFYFTTKEDLLERVNKYLEGPSTIDSRHTREGLVVRVNNSSTFKVAKTKSWFFKVLEGIIKEDAVFADMEESQDI